MSFFTVTKSQNQILDFQGCFLVAECEPGAGATHCLLLKAIKEAKKGNYVVYMGTQPCKYGGVQDALSELLKDVKHKHSKVSNIFELKKGGKIKLLDSSQACTITECDWLLVDHRFKELSFASGVAHQSSHLIAVGYPDTIMGFKKIQLRCEDNIFIDPKYIELARKSIPERFFKNEEKQNDQAL